MNRKTPTTRFGEGGIPRGELPCDKPFGSEPRAELLRAELLRAVSRRGPRGFTLVELLVVIGIIVLLATILVPSVSLAFRLADESRARTRMAVLSNGCEAYYHDYNYYPGQAYPLGTNTGSQVLALCLFTDLATGTFPTAKYAALKTDDLINVVNGVSIPPNTISDQTSEPMAILYYPARLGLAGLAQFVEADNSAYTTGVAWTCPATDATAVTAFRKYIKDRRFDGDASTRPYGQDRYIMITAGVDRIYGTLDDSHLPSW